MEIEYLPNGNLKLSLDNIEDHKYIMSLRERADGEAVAESIFFAGFLPEFEQVRPEDAGALTSAPIISNGKDVFGFMDYQTTNFLEELAAGKTVVFQRG